MKRLLNTALLLSPFFFAKSNTISPVKDTTRQKNCDYKKDLYPDGKIRYEGCMLNGKRDGLWKEYNKAGHLHFEWNYSNGEKNGPYKCFYDSGKLNTLGKYKTGALSDTVKYFEENGKIYKIEVWEVSGKNQSTKTYEKNFNPKIKPDGTIETINGKQYLWTEGQRIDMPK
jgi:hypothetical protein